METLVALTLVLLATTILATFFVAFSRMFLRYDARQDLILLTEKSMLRIQYLLGDSSSSLVTLDSTIHGVCFPVAKGGDSGALQFDRSGSLVWQAWSGFGFDSATGTLWEGRQPFTSTTVLPLASAWTRSTLGLRVSQFAVTGPINKAYRVRILVRDKQNYQAEFLSTVVAQN